MLDGYTMDVLEQRIGYCFHNKALLKQALTHSSYTNEQKINKTENYERIEFLGDAVLELVSSDFLFREHPDVPEGELTKMRASMVCEPSLAFCARDLELGVLPRRAAFAVRDHPAGWQAAMPEQFFRLRRSGRPVRHRAHRSGQPDHPGCGR